MAKFYVTYKVEGRFVAKVDADSIEEAKKQAEEAFDWASFGELGIVWEK